MITLDLQLACMFEQARAYCEEEKNLHAMQLYRRILSLKPSVVSGYLELASLYAGMMRHDLAIGLLQNALSIVPGNEELLCTIGEYHLRLAEYDKALEWFHMLELNKDPQIYFNMGLAYIGKNEFMAAEKQFRLTIHIDPRFPRINGLLGEVLLKLNAPLESIRYLKRENNRDPYCSMNHHLLGRAYGMLGHWRQAYTEFTLAVDMDPETAEHWRWCGEALHRLQRNTEAVHYLRKALEIIPGNEIYHQILTQILAGNEAGKAIVSPVQRPPYRDHSEVNEMATKSSKGFPRGKRR